MRTKLSLLMVLAVLVSFMLNLGTAQAESSASGAVIAWGQNNFNQSSVPASLGSATAIAASFNHTLALRADGTVVAWGKNNYGQSNVPTGLSGVTAVAAGWEHSLALMANGTVVAWGANNFGQSNVPAGLSNVIAIAAGDFHSLALKSDGTVVAWGSNAQGQSSVPAGLSGVTAISAGGAHSLALKSEGTVVAWGLNTSGQINVPLGLSSVTAIASGGYHNLALTVNGHVVGWGDNNYGQLPPSSMSGFSAIAAGYYHSLALKVDGTVVAWGDNSNGQRNVPAGLSGVAAIAAGGNHSVALKAGSVVVGWSTPLCGQNTPPAGLSGVTAIVEGHCHSVALKADGTVAAWGLNTSGQINVPADLSGVVAIAAGQNNNLALKADGAVVSWGNFQTVPTDLDGVTAISAGWGHSLALKADGTVIAWGDNGSGQCNVPAGLSGVKAIAAGENHSLALKADGMVVAWGGNEAGQINIPPGTTGIKAIAAVYSHNLALKADGTVIAWGDNGSGESNVPAGLSGVTAISGGLWHSLALKADGTVVGWGQNDWGQVSIPARLGGVTAIAGSQIHSLAMVSDQDGDVVPDGFDNCSATPNPDQADANHNGVGDACEVAITYQPVNQTAYTGDTVTFSAAASGDPAPSLQWQVSANGGATWTAITGATTSPLTFAAGLDQDGNRYRAVFTNGGSSATSNAATLTVINRNATVTLSNLFTDYDGQPKPVTVSVDPAGLNVAVTYDGSPTAPSAAGTYTVVATVDDPTYLGSASATLTIRKRVAYVTPYDAYKFYGTAGPVLQGFLVNFVDADGVTATFNRTAGEAAGTYTIIGALSPNEKLGNYNITYHTATFTIKPCPASVTVDAKSKDYGEADPALSGTLSGFIAADGVTAAFSRMAGEAPGSYTISATLSPSEALRNYEITYTTAAFTIKPSPVTVTVDAMSKVYGEGDPELTYQVTSGSLLTGDSFSGGLSRAAGENVGSYAINQGSLSVGSNYALTFNGANLTITARPITVTADAKSKNHGEGDPELTYQITSGSLLPGDSLSGTLSRAAGEDGGEYAITQGTLSAGNNYMLNFVGATFTILSGNTEPVANPGGPYLGAVNTAISFDGSASSDPDGDPLNYAWDFGDISSGSGIKPTHNYATTGIYTVCLTVNDGSLDSKPACTLAVVYDPSAGFVTGGGWINSPVGAYKADESLSGKATFGFVSKYQKGASVPTGNTAFQFDLAGLSFASTSYDWLVVNQTATNAQFKGTGLINGLPTTNGNAYKFMLWATDGASTNSADTFRIKIWWEDTAGEHVVYDNGVAQAIGAGNIVVHKSK